MIKPNGNSKERMRGGKKVTSQVLVRPCLQLLN
ncbi:Uncharacterised protein [Vibrio cholerae]|nr:Uncharacterised protein [Vibrio cholerae]CSI76841.1 Uncharacterised protein [Vibrio cholerae]